MFFDGQIYDAFSLLVKLICEAKYKLILIDNYVDVDTINLLSKKNENVDTYIYTQKGSKLSNTDIALFNKQYPKLSLKFTKVFHDRFLIIDDAYAYHIGASVKDAGKKCFGINLIQDIKLLNEICKRL